jgi:8-oxo-dGTP diphosphatase
MAVKRIFSAGGIIIKKDGDGVKVLVTQHSKYKGWDFPKGHLELGETSEQAALREVEEETGVKAEIIEKVGQTQYFYYEDGKKVFKTVTFFLMKFVEQGVATTAFEVSGTKWLSPDEVEGQLTFKDTKELWRKAKEKIEQLF